MRRTFMFVVLGLAVGATAVFVSRNEPASRSVRPAVPAPAAASTSRESLAEAIERNRARLETDPGSGAAAVVLADVLVRSARVLSDPTLALEAERVLKNALQHGPSDYVTRRMLGAVYLAQHRFADALAAAQEAQALRPEDSWNDAVAGDALLELGRYDEAFDAFDAVMSKRPDATAYARVAYARQLQGDLDGARQAMQMAAESMAAPDLEGRAWIYAHIGDLYLLQGRLDDAEREFRRAEFTFPSHPYAVMGRIRLEIARGRHAAALDRLTTVAEGPESAALIGDLQARLGDHQAAEESYRRAERLEREGWQHEQPQPAALARFLAERGRDIPVAVALAEEAIADSQSIDTLDALAWSYFRAGRIADARVAISRATRTGTLDPRIRCHEAAINSPAAAAATTRSLCDPLSLVGAPAAPIRSATLHVDKGGRR